MCEQFKNDYDGDGDGDGWDSVNNVGGLKSLLKVMSQSRLSDSELIAILKELISMYKPKQSNTNSQWVDH